MATATLAWAVDVSTASDLEALLKQDRSEVVEIKLTQDIALTSTINIEHTVTIDLNGYRITADGVRAFHVKNCENVAFTSNKPGAAITVSGAIPAEYSVIRVGNNEGTEIPVSLTIGQNVTVYTDADKCYGVTVFGTKTTETLVVNGTIHTNNRSAISGNGSAGYGNTTITIGETAEITTTNDVAIYHPQNGTLTVHGTVKGAGGIEMKAGSLIVGADAHITATVQQPTHTPCNDGTSTRGYAVAIVENEKYAGVQTIKIDPEADITGPIATLQDSENNNHNPTFDTDGIQMNVSVTSGTDVKQYASLLDAVKEAPEGATIKLLNDVTIKEAAVIDKDNITIDLNGKNITAKGDRALWVKNADASITGTGTISATDIVNPNWSVIQVGNDSEDASLTIGENVTISTNDCYGITTIGTGESSLTVNGTVTTKVRPAIYSTNSFATTIGSTATITTTEEVAIYSTGKSLSVRGEVTGLSAVEIKSGTLTIDGANLTVPDNVTPSHTPNNNGTSTRGYAVAMVKNTNFTPVSTAEFNGTNNITGPVATLIDSGSAVDPTFTGITMLADINGEHYSSVIDATNIVPSDGTVKLMENLALTAPLTLDRHASYKLDLDGHNVAATNSGAFVIKSGDVIITNSNANGATISSAGTVAATYAVICLGDNDGESRNISLGIDNNVTVSTDQCQGVLLSGTNTRESLTVMGTISTTGQSAIVGDKDNGGTTINIEEYANVTSTGNVAIYHPQTGTLTVEGSEVHNAVVSGTTGIEMKAGDLIVGEHAKITGSADSATHSSSDSGPSTSGYGIAIVENANFAGVGNVDIETTNNIFAPVAVAMLVDSKHTSIVEPEFIGHVMLVAEVVGTNTDKYAKLEDAIIQAKTGNTVKMLEDANIASALDIDKNITFDLNDYTITTVTSGYAITTSANATVMNGGIEADNCGGIQATAGTLILNKMTIKAKDNSLNLAGATATIDPATTLTSTTNETVVVGDGATLTVDGKIYNTATNAISGTGTATALTVNSGAIVSANAGHAIDWQASGNLTVEGGKINGTDAVYASKGNVTINGGTFTGLTNGLEVVNANEGDCTISVEHGTFNCGNAGAPIVSSGANAVKHFVKGDYFSKTIEPDLCANGFMISPGTNNNGMYYLISELVITDDTKWTEIKPANSYPIHKAKYIRNQDMGTTHFGTLCLPFSFTPGDQKTTIPTGMTFYTVHEIRDNVLYLNSISSDTEITACTPVIFHRTGTETSFTIECEDADISAGDAGLDNTNTLVGKFVEFKTSGDAVYYLRDDCFHKANGELTVPAFRAYINNPTVSSAKVLNICFDEDENEVDGIESAQNDDLDVEAVYDLQGRKQNGLQKGMNIMKMSNGKTIKVYVNK